MRILPIAASLALLAAAGLGCGKMGDVRDPCTNDKDCKDDLICYKGKCAIPGTCPDDAPIDCGATLPGACCPASHPICCAKDETCHANAADCGDNGKLLGEVCVTSNDCASRLCVNHYCTKRCSDGDDCTGDVNLTTWCLKSATSGFICVPLCITTDCRRFGANVTCRQSTDPSGMVWDGCLSK